MELAIRVNKINWDKIGRVTEPGRYECFFGCLTVKPADLNVWARYPDATFTLITQEQSVGDLGAFDIGNPEQYDGTPSSPAALPRWAPSPRG